ncbi:hypothetical protein HK099_001699, partial [Clydaea vesicula]
MGFMLDPIIDDFFSDLRIFPFSSFQTENPKTNRLLTTHKNSSFGRLDVIETNN